MFSRGNVIPYCGRYFDRVEFLVVLILALSLYGEAYPYGVPLVFPVTVIGFLWFGVIKRSLSLPVNAGFVLLVLCFSLYLVAVIRTSHLYDENRRDVRNAVTLILFSTLLFSLRELREFQSFRDKTQSLGAGLGTALAILGLYKFHLMVNGQIIPSLWAQGYVYPWGTSLIVDYNFYAFAMLCGAVSCFFCVLRFSSIVIKVICAIGFSLNLISLSLSGSRRGWVTEMLLLVALLFLFITWLSVHLLRLGTSMPPPLKIFKIMAVIVLMCTLGPILVNRYQPELMASKDGRLQSELEDLEGRLTTLSDPTESFGPRTSRWEYASQLLDQAPAFKLLFGQGFDYLQVFANVFNVSGQDPESSSREDYPHNPVISAALYSGIVGSFVVVLLISLALFRFIRQWRSDKYFLTLYFASLWFILPAYDTIFSGKLLGFLLLIPWSVPQAQGARVSASSSAHSSGLTYYPAR